LRLGESPFGSLSATPGLFSVALCSFNLSCDCTFGLLLGLHDPCLGGAQDLLGLLT
jgi:hypothetical protein